MKKNVKKTAGLVLICALLLTVLLPVLPVYAKDSVSGYFIASDRHEYAARLGYILEAVTNYTNANGIAVKAAVLAGDNVDNTNSYYLSDIEDELREGLGDDADCYFTYGSHDENAYTSGSSGFLEGPADLGDAWLYGISYDGMSRSSTVSSEISAFNSWIAKLGDKDKKPILMASHLPIHERRHDNAGGEAWLEAVNAAAKNYDIIFFWGHNHTGFDSRDEACVYVPAGGYVTPEGGYGTKVDFTYVNAGFIKERNGSLVAVSDKTVEIIRFDTDTDIDHHSVTLKFPKIPVHVHAPVMIEAKEGTCTQKGNIRYWKCECGKCFADAAATKTISPESTVTPIRHTFGDECVHTHSDHAFKCLYCEAVSAPEMHCFDLGTADEEGKIYTCTVCGETRPEKKLFAKGDVDMDGAITASDARLALRMAVGLEPRLNENTVHFLLADLDGSGVSPSDARTILRISVKLEEPPVPSV